MSDYLLGFLIVLAGFALIATILAVSCVIVGGRSER